ncbi:ABC transporter substrate-binding protein [Devosia sp. SL43]|uniref:ABC transporter substrate-binding protein n=1 Tax=Devosia sp. SL43 TaxID=2806348 RepID=UPI001F3E5774|nr:ABC transporter substrate-binding protein [Devosia sp. SL43]UJW86060.1 ABC transporter substrate-binding protein [Devosia sp. SL43]
MSQTAIRAWLAASAITLLLALPALAQEFPLTIEHKFGTTVIPAKPERVASIDYAGIDNLLAVGVSPVTVRQWRPMDGFEHTAGPWAAPLLTTEPLLLSDDLDFEAIAATEPDVIIALYSGIDQAAYDKLSLIAPVVAVPEGSSDYGLSWEDRARMVGRAVGEEAEAERRIEAIGTQLADIAAAHPDWADKTAVLGGITDGAPWAYSSYDVRAKFLYEMGFSQTPAMADLADPSEFWLELSPEQLEVIDADVIVYYVTDDLVAEVLAEPGRGFFKASKSGGEVFLGNLPVAAMARVSLLSIPVVLETLVPMLEAASDGDSTTVVPDARQ